MKYENAINEVKLILADTHLNLDKSLKQVCQLLKDSFENYDWVGFYFKNGNKDELRLKAFAGEPTDHEIIPFGKGICGQVALSNKNFVVPDVNAQDNYISCNINVKSEVVIPLFVNEENIGQIDIDSNTLDAFSSEDEKLLEEVNVLISSYLQKNKLLPIFS